MLDRFGNELGKFGQQIAQVDEKQVQEIDEQIQQLKNNLAKFPQQASLYKSCIDQLLLQKQNLGKDEQGATLKMDRATHIVDMLKIQLNQGFQKAISDLRKAQDGDVDGA